MESNIPKDDLWELIDNDINSQNYGKKFEFSFSYIENESIKNIVKAYIWRNYKEGKNTLSYLFQNNFQFKIVNQFLNLNNIKSFRSINNSDIDNFVTYIKTIKSNSTGKIYASKTQRNFFNTLKAIIDWLRLYKPEYAPINEVFEKNYFPLVARKITLDFIPDEILKEINIYLKDEKNIYLKAGMIILQSTGIRIGDVLNLNIDCIKPKLLGYTLNWYEHKTRRERAYVPITDTCANVIKELINHTENIRKNADYKISQKLFLYPKTNKEKGKDEVALLDYPKFKEWMKQFVKNNNIRDYDGKLYNLKTHQFRKTIATDMFSKNVDLKVIQEFLGHSDAIITKRYYADVKDKERAEIFKKIGIIGNINKVNEMIIANKEDLVWFKDNINTKSRMCDGYCTKPFKDGQICDRLLKRQKCYTCSRYITTPEYLQVHKNHLRELENQLEGNIYGDHYAEHFLPTIEILKEIVNRLEELQDGNREVTINNNK